MSYGLRDSYAIAMVFGAREQLIATLNSAHDL